MTKKASTIHKILDDRVQLWRRDGHPCWYCSCSLNGKQRKKGTKENNIERAKDIAEAWYIELRAKQLAGVLDKDEGMVFRAAAKIFLREYGIITEGQRSPLWVKSHELRIRLHLNPFLGDMSVRKIDSKVAQEYRIHRATECIDAETGKPIPPSRSTMHDEFVTLRMVLKAAIRYKELEHLPDLSPPYRASVKVEHRPWFSREEYKQLYTATRDYARNPRQAKDRWNAEQVHDYVLFLGNTGLRPDEAKNLQHRDVKVVKDKDTGELILEIEVRGKRGVGYCKSTPNAVKPYQRLAARPKWEPQGRKPRSKAAIAIAASAPTKELQLPKPTDLVFPGNHIKLFNGILERTGLKNDRHGKARTAYSLRHTYICLRLIEGADIYSLAKNCRTSVEMIQKHYAAHIKDLLDTTLINTRRSRSRNSKRDGARED